VSEPFASLGCCAARGGGGAGGLAMAASPGAVLEERFERLNSFLAGCEPVQRLAHICGLKPLAVAAAGVGSGLVLWSFTGELLCTILGCAYPMYASFLALEEGNLQQVSRWLMYWVVFAAVTLANTVFRGVLCWLPFYYLMRMLLIAWLFTPKFGAEGVYHLFVRPVLRTYRTSIDLALDRSAEELCGKAAGDEAVPGQRSKFHEAWRRAAKAQGLTGSRSKKLSEELGLQEMVAEELTRGAEQGLHKVATAARRRIASPAPPPLHRGPEAVSQEELAAKPS